MIIMIEGEIYLRILLVNLSYNYSILILRVISVLGKFFVPQISTKYQKISSLSGSKRTLAENFQMLQTRKYNETVGF